MSRSVEGLFALNVLLGASGLVIVWAFRGIRSWLELVELLGVGLMLGLASVSVLATALLSLGGGLSLAAILGLAAAVALAAGLVGLRARSPLPRALGVRLAVRSAGLYAACVPLLFAAFFLVLSLRLARVQPLVSYDGWSFWVPKAKAIYFFGGLDHQLFTSLPGPSYPLLVPALQAMDFRFMGSADASALTLQYWLLFVAFLLTAAAVLRRVVPAWLVWLFLALATVLPELDQRLTMAQADWPLDMFFALTAVFLVRWLRSRDPWLLVGFGVMFSATVATKREGLLLVACLVAGALLAWLRDWRRTWPPLLAVGIVAYLPNLPWHFWWTSRQLSSDRTPGGLHELASQLSRAWPSLELVLRLLFSYGLWLAPLPIALVAASVVLTRGGETRRLGLTMLATCLFAVVGFTWVLWQDPQLPLDTQQSSTPIPRLVGSLVLMAVVLAPLLLEPLLRLRRVRAPLAEPAAPPE